VHVGSADNKDIIPSELAQAGHNWLQVPEGQDAVGNWAIFEADGNGRLLARETQVDPMTGTFQPAAYCAGTGASYEGVGNTEDYTLALAAAGN
jgi:hypothetical protein